MLPSKGMDTGITELELKVLHEISQIISQALNLEQTLEKVLEILSDSLSMERATIALKDAETGHLLLRASYGLTPEEKSEGVYLLDERVTSLIFHTTQPLVVSDISKEPLFLQKTESRRLEKRPISFMGVPIILQGAAIGVLSVDRLGGEDISLAEDVRFLSIVALLIAQFVSLNLQFCVREENLRRENLSLRTELSERSQNLVIIGKGPALMEVQQLIKKGAISKAPVLLTGESGTGKTLVARIIHELSPRAKYPWVKINCASRPDDLLETELFGYEKDAFPGATKAKPGRLEEADGGSVFLEEVGELSPACQAKLLRFLQEREFERLGSRKTRKVEVRVFAATSKGLTEVVNEGRFRGDLYYRLNVLPINLPPLRERPEDLPALLNYFLDKVSKEYGRRFYVTQKALEVLREYDWPGNVRELENLVERLGIMVEGSEIDLPDLPPYLLPASQKVGMEDHPFLTRLKKMEKREILAALERNRWIQSQAAMELGLTLRQIGYRVKQFGLDRMIKEQRRQAPSSSRS